VNQPSTRYAIISLSRHIADRQADKAKSGEHNTPRVERRVVTQIHQILKINAEDLERTFAEKKVAASGFLF
jgi:hypothetical protein